VKDLRQIIADNDRAAEREIAEAREAVRLLGRYQTRGPLKVQGMREPLLALVHKIGAK
jgi:hypothetical protein